MKKLINKKIMVLIIVIFIILLLSTYAFFSIRKIETTVSAGARAVIETMMTCPNLDLYNKDMLHGNEYFDFSDAEKERIQALMDKSDETWEAAVGAYFGYGYLEKFIYQGPAGKYLMIAENEGITISVKEMTLIEKTLLKKAVVKETVLVTLLINETEQQVTFVFRYDTEGLIKSVQVIENE